MKNCIYSFEFIQWIFFGMTSNLLFIINFHEFKYLKRNTRIERENKIRKIVKSILQKIPQRRRSDTKLFVKKGILFDRNRKLFR